MNLSKKQGKATVFQLDKSVSIARMVVAGSFAR